MRLGALLLAGTAVAISACGGNVPATGAGNPPPPAPVELSTCAPGAVLRGTTYDIMRSRFAFGSTPVLDDANGLMRWVGDHGVVAIWPSGAAQGSMNAGAPERNLPDWSNDVPALEAHVRAYFVTFNIDACQMPTASALGGSGGRTIELPRSVDGISVAESRAFARFESENQTTDESLYWPTVSAEVVTAARALRDRLTDPAQLAAYKALLPGDAQGDGVVRIHHTSSVLEGPFQAAATYDVVRQSTDTRGASNLSFDASGAAITTIW
jgi:hypothetical protein